ncbi:MULTISPECIES: thioesterase, FlK family [unclassified Frankia]|uniref:thioesterase, FlK family n=1 Tax=unclassified Frankia TaxID=2632575 RepID=UPI0020243E2F
MTAQLIHTVAEIDCADRWANELPVLATPVLLWLAELACMDATATAVDGSQMTLGLSHSSTHLAPTLLGDTIVINATLTKVEGGTLEFTVHADDSNDRILSGIHQRAVVDRSRFLRRLESKRATHSRQAVAIAADHPVPTDPRSGGQR